MLLLHFYITISYLIWRETLLYDRIFYIFVFVAAHIIFFPGPVLLEDYHLVEKLANFDRERIAERVVHARGASAKGFFEVTHDITHLTCADFLRAPGVQTPVIVRFSTVIHERGSPETLRDPRGFAVKFYTREVCQTSI